MNDVIYKITSRIPNHHATIRANCEYMDEKIKHKEKPPEEIDIKGGGWLMGLPDPVWAMTHTSKGSNRKHSKVVVSFSEQTKKNIEEKYIDFARASKYVIKRTMIDWGEEYYPLSNVPGYVYGVHRDTDNLHYHLIVSAVGEDGEDIDLVGRLESRKSAKGEKFRELLKHHVEQVLESGVGDWFVDRVKIAERLDKLLIAAKNEKKITAEIKRLLDILETPGNLLTRTRAIGRVAAELVKIDMAIGHPEDDINKEKYGMSGGLPPLDDIAADSIFTTSRGPAAPSAPAGGTGRSATMPAAAEQHQNTEDYVEQVEAQPEVEKQGETI